MRRTAATLLVMGGFLLAVAVPIAVALGANVDFGQRPGVLVATAMPGVTVMALATRLWRARGPERPGPEQVPPGHRVCDLCRKPVPVVAGTDRRLDVSTAAVRSAFVCHACARYRTRRAVAVLLVFLAALGVAAIVIPRVVPKRNRG